MRSHGIQMKLLYFANSTADNSSKIGHIFRNLSFSDIEVIKRLTLQKKCPPKLTFLTEKNQK